MKQQQVIENFITERSRGRGLYVKANENVLYSEIPQWYSLWKWSSNSAGQSAPLAVRLQNGDLLVNGASLPWPIADHQFELLQSLKAIPASRYGVVPFHSIVAAWTDGEIRDWNQKPIPTKRLQKEVGIVVPSAGERWRVVPIKDEHGRIQRRWVHTLGDSVVRIRDRYYLSSVDETGRGWGGMYFLTELSTDRPPETLKEAFQLLKPQVVRVAEAHGSNVRRQGEWFAIPANVLTSQLMRDVQRGIALYRQRHVLGGGHHELEEAVIYRYGNQKGEVYARGVVKHISGEHHELDLGMVRWHLMVHNVAGQSYTLSGTQTLFD